MQSKVKNGRLWIVAVIFHLCFVTAGAAHFSFRDVPVIGAALNMYGEISGANMSYGFFSPGIYGQLQALIDVYDTSGNKTTRALVKGENREADLRMNDIVDSFLEESEDKMQFQRTLAASLAGTVFATEPNAELVNVRIESFPAISRQAFLAGERADWKPAYSAKFAHKKRPQPEAK